MTEPDPEFEVVGTEHHYKGWVIDVRTDQVRMPDGAIAKRDVIDHPGAVAVVALDEADHVVMVRQYRHPVRAQLLELPAGLLDLDGESALTAAKRELYEETALTAQQWWVLLDLHTSPGMTSEAIRIYLARGLTDVPVADQFQAEHEEITLTVERYSLDDVVSQALRGELTNGPAVAGVLAAQVARDQGWTSLRPVDSSWAARPDR
jgi:8-oxo-dGTP pyrophosphatase MutT (NUDIX family)